MVVFQDADAHPLVRGQITEFRQVYVIKVFHPDRELVRPVSRCPAKFERDIQPLEFHDRFFCQTAALLPPEPHAYLQFIQIVVPGILRKGVQKEKRYFFQVIPSGSLTPRHPIATELP